MYLRSTIAAALAWAIGMGEVRQKAKKIVDEVDDQKKSLEDDPIKVIRGPNGELFVVDHHHGARAWLLSGYSNGTCQLQTAEISTVSTQFWAQLVERKLVRLADKDGVAITPDALPKTLNSLPDDPYRTLAYLVRQKDGFCRAMMDQKEFAEFIWADWMRGRAELPASKVIESPELMLPAALSISESPAAKDLPGYRGNELPTYKCPKEK